MLIIKELLEVVKIIVDRDVSIKLKGVSVPAGIPTEEEVEITLGKVK